MRPSREKVVVKNRTKEIKNKFKYKLIKTGITIAVGLMLLKGVEANYNVQPYTFVTQGLISMLNKAVESSNSADASQIFEFNNETFDYNNCGVPLGTGFCAPQNLAPYFEEARVSNPYMLADKFSRICQRESASDPTAFNNSGFVNGTVDVSAGFFQMNLLAHCSTAFIDAHGNTGLNFNAYDLPVRVGDGNKLKECLLPLVIDEEVMREVNPYLPFGTSPLKLDDPNIAREKADIQIRGMIDLYKRDGLQPWSMGSRGCSIR